MTINPRRTSTPDIHAGHPRRTSAHSLNRRNQFQHPHLLRGLVFIFTLILILTACDMYGFYDDGIHYITGTEYDLYGYNKDGYNAAGFNDDGNHRNGTKYGPDGYDEQGYDAEGFNAAGYDVAGYNKDGFNAEGNHRDTNDKYNLYGYDRDGYNVAGFNADGNYRDGTKYGPDGYDINGYDKNGFNADGIYRANRLPYDRYGYDKYGYDAWGYAADGYNAAGVYRDDFTTLSAAGNAAPRGIWSDGTTMWVADDGDDKIYAYNMISKKRDADKDFDTLVAAGNTTPTDIWSDGTTMWVLNLNDGDNSNDTPGKIYAYNMISKENKPDETIPLSNATTSQLATSSGIWSDGTAMWTLEKHSSSNGVPIDAWDISTKAKTGIIFAVIGTSSTMGIWSDRITVWVVVGGTTIAAHTFSGTWVEEKDIAITITGAYGLWSNDTTMWVSDTVTDRIYAYDLATRARPPKTETE
ncbi:MAG: hypothetical protein ACR2PY_05745 [Salinispira sp.]